MATVIESTSAVDDSRTSKLGIIAGGGALPRLLASACESTNKPFFVLGLEGCADSSVLAREPDAWVRLGEIGKGLTTLHEASVNHVVLAGSVRRPALSELKPDLKGASVLAKIAGRALGDDNLLTVVINEIEREGFTVVGADDVLSDLLADQGPLGKHTPDEVAKQDIDRGIEASRALGAADIGQASVVQQGIVLGLEASEGTDDLLSRCASLRREGPGGVLVKVKKPHQERRVDLPTIGAATIENAHAAGLRGIAVETGHALIIDKAAVAELADRLGLFVVGCTKTESGLSVE